MRFAINKVFSIAFFWVSLVVLCATSIYSYASKIDYDELTTERSRILSLPVPTALEELEKSRVIKPLDPLGKYFYNVTRFNIDSTLPIYPLNHNELNELEAQHYEFYLEKHLLDTFASSQYSTEETLLRLQGLINRAKNKNLKRIERLGKALMVDIEIAQKHYFSAMLMMRSVLQDAPTEVNYSVLFDYDLTILYLDLAKVLFFLGDYESSLDNCKKVSDLYDDESPNKVQAQLCEARANVFLGNYSQALILLESALEKSEKFKLYNYQMYALTYLIKTYNAMGLVNEAEQYFKLASQLRHIPLARVDDYAYFLMLYEYIKVLIKLDKIDDAKSAYNEMTRLLPAPKDMPEELEFNKIQEIQARIDYAEGRFQEASEIFKELAQLDAISTTEKFSFSELPKFTDELDNRQLIDLKERAERSDILLKISLVIGVVLATWLSRLIWVARKQEHSLAYYTSKGQMDSRTGLLNAEMITRKITQLLKYNGTLTADKQKQYTLAVIQVSGLSEINQTCGYDVGDAILLRVGRAMKTVLSHDDFLVGRLDGLQFLALLNGVTTESCENKLRTIEQLIDYKSVSALPTTLQHSIDISFIIKRVDNSEQVKSAIANGRRQLFKEAASLKDEPDPNERFNPFQV